MSGAAPADTPAMTTFALRPARPRLAELVVGVVALAWAGVLLQLRRDPGAAQTLSNVGLWAIALTAGVGAFRRSLRHEGTDRRFWLLIGAATTSWAMGQLIWNWYESVLHREVPFPSLSDVGYLGLPPLAAAAMLALPLAAQSTAGGPDHLRRSHGRCLAPGAQLGARPAARLRRGRDSLLNTSHLPGVPGGRRRAHHDRGHDLLRARRAGPSRCRVPLPLLGSGLLAFAVSDCGFTYETTRRTYSSGSVIDLGWFARVLLVLLAALRAEPAGAPRSTTRRSEACRSGSCSRTPP